MNFIDKALKNHLNADDFLQAMTDIYNEPEVRDRLYHYPEFIRNIILIIDYDTDLAMDGLKYILDQYDTIHFSKLLIALEACSATKESQMLRMAKEPSSNLDLIYNELALMNPVDYDHLWNGVRNYIHHNLKQQTMNEPRTD